MVNSTTPAIVTQSAVRRLPRVALFLFCLAYVLPGYVGREPWKSADVTAFGAMLEMAARNSGWWLPQVLGQPVEVAGPLPYWLGALAIRWLPFLPSEWAVRFPFALLLALTLACTWYTVYHLARQRAAQPVAFAFGGEANPKDYARALADAGLLALVASLGLAQLSHETTPDVARLAAVATMLYAAARLVLPEQRRTWVSLLAWTLSAGALVLSGAPWIAMALGTGLLVCMSVHQQPAPYQETARVPMHLRVLAAAALLIAALGLGFLFNQFSAPTALALPGEGNGWTRWGRLLLWFTWPAWPLTMWTLWRWRRQWFAPHVSLPLWAAVVSVVNSGLNPDFERALLLALPALATLAAFALPTLRRSVSALIDWFTLIFFTGCALVIWVIWISMQTGVPAKPAANVARLAPGFNLEFSAVLLVIGLCATAAWIWLVAWRVGRNRQAIWKSLVLPAAGSTLCWLLLNSLWLPLLDYGRSYGPLTRRIATLVPAKACVLVDGLNQAQISALRYHGRLNLQRINPGQDQHKCRGLVVAPTTQPTLDERVDLTEWAFKATVRRLNDRNESLLVYQRITE